MVDEEVHTERTQESAKSEPRAMEEILPTYNIPQQLLAKPMTEEIFTDTTKTAMANSDEERKKTSSRRFNERVKPTVLTFAPLEYQSDVAKCLLLLCNISERVLHFRMKSSGDSNIVSVPFGNGQIAPHAQVRLILKWTRAAKYKEWAEVPQPKLILTTRFLDEPQKDTELTHTRLVAKLSKESCTAANPPVEQLLLDAVKASREAGLDNEAHFRQEVNLGRQLANFINNLSNRGICALIIILTICMLVFTGSWH